MVVCRCGRQAVAAVVPVLGVVPGIAPGIPVWVAPVVVVAVVVKGVPVEGLVV